MAVLETDTAPLLAPPTGQRTTLQPAARLALGLFAAGLSAALLILAFPPYGLWPFIWVGFVPLLVAQHRLLPPRLSSLAPAIAVGGWLGGYLVPLFAGYDTYMNWLPLIIGAIVLLINWSDRAFHQGTGYRWFILDGAVGWIGIEVLRSFVPIMGTWGFLGYTLYAQPWLIQPVSLFSIFGLDLLIAFVNYALAQGVLVLLDRRWTLDREPPLPPRPARRWLIGVGLALVAWVGLSLALFAASAVEPTVRVAAVQVPGRTANNRSYQQDPAARAALFQQLADQTRAAAQAGAELVVWPEGALNADPQTTYAVELRALTAATGTHLALGYMIPRPSGPWRNEATVLSPDGTFLGVYGKEHPVVFGGETNTALGQFPVYDTPAGRVGTIICYDLDFTDTARRVAGNGAQIIAVPSLDWPAIATKHYGHLVFRAIENGTAMVKADGGYDSAIIGPNGQIIAHAVTPEGAAATLVADVPLRTGQTLVTRLGDWPIWPLLASLAFSLIAKPVLLRQPHRRADRSTR